MEVRWSHLGRCDVLPLTNRTLFRTLVDMNTLPATISATDARRNLYDMLDEVGKYLKRFVIVHKGKPQAVLLSVEDLESWEETLDIISNKTLMMQIRKSERDYEAGRVTPLRDVLKKMDIHDY